LAIRDPVGRIMVAILRASGRVGFAQIEN